MYISGRYYVRASIGLDNIATHQFRRFFKPIHREQYWRVHVVVSNIKCVYGSTYVLPILHYHVQDLVDVIYQPVFYSHN